MPNCLSYSGHICEALLQIHEHLAADTHKRCTYHTYTLLEKHYSSTELHLTWKIIALSSLVSFAVEHQVQMLPSFQKAIISAIYA